MPKSNSFIFDNIKNEKRELLFIFALLIFQFQRIFKNEEYTNISKYILQYSAKKTYEYLKTKGLKCPLLFECTYTKFLYYLDNTIMQLNQKKLKNQISNLIINNNSKLNSSNVLPISNEIRPFPSDNNNNKNKDDKDYNNSPISSKKKEDNKNKEENIKAINLEKTNVSSLPVLNTFQSKGNISNIDSSMKTIIPHDDNSINSTKNKINEPLQKNISQNNASNLEESTEEIFMAGIK